MTQKGIPYFNFYPEKFMTGVRGLTPQEVGVYILLLCLIYEEGRPVDVHEARLSTYCGMTPAAFGKVFNRLVDLGKLTVENGRFMNDRAAEEIAKREIKLNSSKLAGKISAEKRQQNQGKPPTTVEQPFNHKDKDKISSVDTSVSTAADAAADPSKLAFDAGVAMLTKAGKSPGAARSLIGKWVKAHKAEAVIVALGRAQREGAVDPVAFIEGIFKALAKAGGRNGERRQLADGRWQSYDSFNGWVTEHV